MDAEILYSLFGIFIFGVIIFLTLRMTPSQNNVKTKEQKKEEIILEYKQKLQKSLQAVGNEKELRVAEKTKLIKSYSDELARNIFFDADEVREIILELSSI